MLLNEGGEKVKKSMKGTLLPRFFITVYKSIVSKFKLKYHEKHEAIYISKIIDDYNDYLSEMMKHLDNDLRNFSKEAEKLMHDMNLNKMSHSVINDSSLRGEKDGMNDEKDNIILSFEMLCLKIKYNHYIKMKNMIFDELSNVESMVQVYLTQYGKRMKSEANKNSNILIPHLDYQNDERVIHFQKVEKALLESIEKVVGKENLVQKE